MDEVTYSKTIMIFYICGLLQNDLNGLEKSYRSQHVGFR